MSKKHAIIIGAGPAGLTAAYYLAKFTDIKPIVLEKETFVGGISRTMNFGCHVGDKIKFGVAQLGEQNILLYLPTAEGGSLE